MWMLARQFQLSDLLLAAGLLLLSLALLSRLRRRRLVGQSQPTAREKIERDRQLRAMRGDLEQVMVQVEELARQFSAKLDAKTIALERLLREAEAKIHEMKALGKGRSESGPGDPRPGSGVSGAGEGGGDPLARSVYALADEGLTSAQIAQRLEEHVGKVELILSLREAS